MPGIGGRLLWLWEEYLQGHPGHYRYTCFIQRFRAWQGAHAEPRLRREHRPGAAIEVDHTDMTLTIGLGAQATWTRQSEEWLASLSG